MRILVVDDEPAVCRFVCEALTAEGHEVWAYTESATALEALVGLSPDAALVDYHMPAPNGLEVLRILRDSHPRCIRILLSGNVNLPLALEAVNRGEVARVIPKPFDLLELLDELEGAVRSRRRIEESCRAEHSIRESRELAMLGYLLRHSSLFLHYQPIVDSETRRPVAYEALLRSRHPILDGPAAVLRAAERHGRVLDVAAQVAQLASRAIALLPLDVELFLNLHPLELLDPASLARRLVPLEPFARRVVLEITERADVGAITNLETTILLLQERGFRFAVDDLGAGYNSLSVLANLNPDTIKVDMSIVRGVDGNSRKRRLIQLLATFGDAVSARVVGEGVETAREAEALRECGVHLLQGFFFGRPTSSRALVSAAAAL